MFFRLYIKNIFLLLSGLFFVLMAYSKQQYNPPVFMEDDRLIKIQKHYTMIDKLYQEYAEKNHFPGYAFGIILDGKLIHSGSGGYIDLNKKIPATTKSMFRVASMTKSFTAMAILKLRDEGKLKLDDPISLYIPEFKEKLTQDSPAITVRNLLTHSSGLPQDDPWGDRKLEETDDELIALFKKGISFSNVPGTTYEYSNLAFATLGYIIKKVSGLSYEKYISRNIFIPLKMKDAAWEFKEVPSAYLAHGYKWVDYHWQNEKLLHDGIFGAMGGLIASVESFSEYVAFQQYAWPARNETEKEPLKRSSIREMQQPWRFNELTSQFKYPDGRECAVAVAYGYGLHWARNCEGKVYIGHSGGLPGFGSNWLIMPDYGIGIIGLANVTYAPVHDLNLNILNTLVKSAQLKPMQLPASQILKERQKNLIKLLPEWKNAVASGIFSENFFQDSSVESRKKQTIDVFSKAGKILRIGNLIPENQLRGYFILEGEKANIQISFALTAENPSLIEKYEIKKISNQDQKH